MKSFFTIAFVVISSIIYGQIYSSIDGKIHFVSDAPLELIEADSDQMQGIIDLEKKTFAFKIYIKSFHGFNSPLQQVHFYENYMETNEYPIALFKGKILEEIKQGKTIYRAKGILDIHGQALQRIIEVELDIQDNLILYNSTFFIPLADHNIELPRIVYQKIAKNIRVTVSGFMQLKK